MRYLNDIWNEVLTWCYPGSPIVINYGILYNWYAATDARNIANTGWHVPTPVNMEALRDYLDPLHPTPNTNVAGGLMKETGLTYWNTPNTGATNLYGFNARATGLRNGTTGVFTYLGLACGFWTTLSVNATSGNYGSLYYNANYFFYDYDPIFPAASSATLKSVGAPIRLIKDSTTLLEGESGIYVGNDGKIYRTIAIGAPGSVQELVADNIAETLYRDLTPIPIVTDNAAWAALVTGAMCYYNNNSSFI
jgi:uncharacterized protein (TIGR02145 family)